MRIAVTGGSGFLGRYVLADLAMRGVETIATSRSGVIAHAQRGQAAHPIDLACPPENPYVALGCPDVVIHLAWSGLPNYHSLHHLETELPRQYAFLSSLVRKGLRRLVVVGTCFEYGMCSGPLAETQTPQPANPYGFAKDTLRRQLEFLQAETEFALTWVRLFYLYGEGQGQRSLYSQLRAAVAAGDKLFPMSGGEQLRDFLEISDAVGAVVALALREGEGEGAGIVNVCSGTPISVRALVERWISANGWDIQLDRGRYPYPDYEPFAFWGNRTKLDSLLS